MTFKADWTKAKRAYKNAPHGTKRARLKDLQKMVAVELVRECSGYPHSTQATAAPHRGKIAA